MQIHTQSPHLGRILLAAVAALGLLASIPATRAAEAKQPKLGDGRGGVKLKKLGSFDNPVHLDNAPGFRRLMFVVEQPGAIRVLRGRKTLKRPFLEINNLVECCGEEGLLSVAFPPDYKRSKRFYVYYTANGGDVNRVDEFRRAGRKRADRGSRRTVIEFSHPDFGNHNGGQLQFGPDGYLYIGTGDGGGGGDPDGNGQDPSSPLGKLLRINPRASGTQSASTGDIPSESGAYSVPADNPFVGGPGLDEIYSLGLRNPWRFSFDRRKDRIGIADVGQGDWEEVNYERLKRANGANFGWDAFEGTDRFDTSTPAPPDPEFPIHQYRNSGTNCAVVGGYVVRDRRLKSLYGRYLYADYCAGELRSFVPRLGGAKRDRPLGRSVSSPTTFGEGIKGRIYVASQDGRVLRVRKR